jgi:uncharacterized protein YeaO (DUF488 family)
MTLNIQLKRAYEPAEESDGFRVLVERLWPRGISKERAHIDLWDKEIAPSTELRKWYNHELDKWPEFQKKYQQELRENSEAVEAFRKACGTHKKVTFIYSAHDEQHNSAVVFKHFLEHQLVKH